MVTETRTVHFTVDPALRAYLEWIDAEGREFDREAYSLFAAGYRARDDEQQPATPTGEAAAGEAAG